jgi:hypothetical protein
MEIIEKQESLHQLSNIIEKNTTDLKPLRPDEYQNIVQPSSFED